MAALKKRGERVAAPSARGPEPDPDGKYAQGGKTDESSVAIRRDLKRSRTARAAVGRTDRRRSNPRRRGQTPASAHIAHFAVTAFNQGHSAPFYVIRRAFRCRTRRPFGARPGKRIRPVMVPPAGGQSRRLARQACVRFSDDCAVLEVECPGFCDQFADTCEPASGFGGTVRDIGRLHDEAHIGGELGITLIIKKLHRVVKCDFVI
ncbi:hypothetical protein GEM_4324 [Burkholderia cepacia GG4]|uniref:Uncharacterized protein n=1 Tax=Burkholderia cepacia GG4 TaxID=1009846 RepID=A0A9W3K427_BURCE|nr:hypothetical protein GEM_4324 [Burkholderia cepacia GG4]